MDRIKNFRVIKSDSSHFVPFKFSWIVFISFPLELSYQIVLYFINHTPTWASKSSCDKSSSSKLLLAFSPFSWLARLASVTPLDTIICLFLSVIFLGFLVLLLDPFLTLPHAPPIFIFQYYWLRMKTEKVLLLLPILLFLLVQSIQ